MPVNNYIITSDGNFISSDELYHWKYIKREKIDGKWKYYYSWDELKKDVNAKVDQVKTNIAATKTANQKKLADAKEKVTEVLLEKANALPDKIDTAVDKAKTVVNKIYDNKDNIYEVTPQSYDKKVEQIKQSAEWKEIVAKSDPEYVKKTSDGKTNYLLDDYIVKKKHPVLDVIDDIAHGRKVSVNKITKDTVVAGLKDYAFGAIKTGSIVVGAAAKILTEKYKLAQGSYQDEIEYITDQVQQGAAYMKDTAYSVNKDYVTPIASSINTTQNQIPKAIDEDKVIAVAKDIITSSAATYAGQAMANLSEEELRALYFMMQSFKS